MGEAAVTLRTARLVLLASLLIFAVRVGLYISLLPANEMPDELAHVQQIRLAQYWPEIKAGEIEVEPLMRELTAAPRGQQAATVPPEVNCHQADVVAD